MQLKFESGPCQTMGQAVRGVQNGELTQELRLSDGMPDIGRVLGSWGQAVLRSKEWRGDQITAGGGLMVWVLYAPEDGSEARCVESWIPFQLKWDTETSGREGPVRILPRVRFVDSRTVSARKMMVRVGIAAQCDARYPMTVEISRAGELPEDVQVLKAAYPLRLPREAGEKAFQLEEEIDLPGNLQLPAKLAGVQLQPELRDQKVLTDKILFRGVLLVHLILQGPDGAIKTWDGELPFSQFAELDGSYGSSARVDIQIALTGLETEWKAEGQLEVKAGLVAQYLVEEQELVETIQDAYSPRREVAVQMEPLQLPVTLEERKETISVSQPLSTGAGEVVDVVFLPDYPAVRSREGGVDGELTGVFQLLTRGEEGDYQLSTARWEGKLPIPADESCQIQMLPRNTGNIQARPAREGMELTGELEIQVLTGKNSAIPMAVGVELGEEKTPDPARPSLILLRSGKESLWQLARACGTTVEEIQRANGLTEEPAPDKMLLIPIP